jgi:hypothetical protein
MRRTFHRSTNTIARLSIFGSVFILAGLAWMMITIGRSPYVTEAGIARRQPVPFSHKHHVGDDGIDCRYCHTTVETSSYAGMPSTQTCMNCHSQIWSDSPMLEPVRASFREGEPLRWTRVHNLPEFVYFDHSIHVNKGVGCSTCHGRVDEMPLTYQVASLQMEWCLECHSQPEKFVRPREEVFNMRWEPPANQDESGRGLVKTYKIRDARSLTSCSTCHR